MLLAESVAKIVGLGNVKKRKCGKVEKNEIFFSFFSRIAVEISRKVF